jgi:hypothetical protein
LEEGGSYILADGRRERHPAVAAPVGAKSNLAILAELLNIKLSEERENICMHAEELIAKGMPREKVDLQAKLFEVTEIVPQPEYPLEEVFHFGQSRWVNKFFWHRLNSEGIKT